MEFWLQNNNDIDIKILKNELDLSINKITNNYEFNTKENFNEILKLNNIKNKYDIIPVGDLDFIKNFLLKVYNINNMNPIEVPLVLRKKEFLKRDYKILDKNDLPKNGYYFTKYVSKLKIFSHTGMIESLQYTNNNKNEFLKDGLYQVSEVVDIISEYRIFVHNDKIIGINYYDGNFTIMPNIEEINNMINEYKKDIDRPKAYTIDIAIIKDRGTAILEIHPFVSVGLYGYMFSESLLYCYRDGFEYYKKINKKIEL